MKSFIFVGSILFFNLMSSQEKIAVQKFQAVDCSVAVKINIIKSKAHKIEFKGAQGLIDKLKWEVLEGTLKIDADVSETDFENVEIDVHTPELSSLSLLNGGTSVMDSKFSRMNSFVVSAANNAFIDLSNIDFNTLVANSKKDGHIVYKSVNTLVFTNKREGKVEQVKKGKKLK